MSRRQLARVLVAVAAVLAAWLVFRPGDASDGRGGLNLGAAVDTSIVALRIREPDGASIGLERRDRTWTVNGYPAEDSIVATVLARLDTLRPARLVATNRDNHARLGVTPEVGRSVELRRASGPAVEFLLGKPGPEGYFVRMPGSDDVFSIPTQIGSVLAQREPEWRDLTIARVDTSTVGRITITRRDSPPVDVARGSSGWLVDGSAADSAALGLYLQLLANLEASGFPADSFVFAADFDRPVATVDIFGPPGPTNLPEVSLLFATALDHPHVLVRLATNPIVYTLEPELANLLTSGASRLRARPQP